MPSAAQRRRARAQSHLLNDHFGSQMRLAGQTWVGRQFTTPDEVVPELAQGITMRLLCGRGDTFDTRCHVSLRPDGSVVLDDHDGRVFDAEAEAFMHQLSGSWPTSCTRILTTALTTGNGGDSWVKYTRVLRAAVSWAQTPERCGEIDWWTQTPEWRGEIDWWVHVVGKGISRPMLDAYLDAGWDTKTAMMFATKGVFVEQAELWRRAGDVTSRAAGMAAKGMVPSDDAPWEAVGLSRATSAPWRRTGFTPAEVVEFRARKMSPSVAKQYTGSIKRATDPDAARALMDSYLDHPGLPAAKAMEWMGYRHAASPNDASLSPTQVKTLADSGIKPWPARRCLDALAAAQPSVPHTVEQVSLDHQVDLVIAWHHAGLVSQLHNVRDQGHLLWDLWLTYTPEDYIRALPWLRALDAPTVRFLLGQVAWRNVGPANIEEVVATWDDLGQRERGLYYASTHVSLWHTLLGYWRSQTSRTSEH